MDVRDYCKGTELELTAWKARLYDMSRKFDLLPSGDKERVLQNVEDLHIIVQELEDRISQLQNECPAQWDPVVHQIETAHVDMRAKYEQTIDDIGRFAPVSIPG